MRTSSWATLVRPALLTAVLVAVDIATSYSAELPTTGPVERLNDFLAASGRTRGADFTVQVEDHIAHLSGTVRTIDQAEFIAESAMCMDEVFGIVQDLRVDAPAAKAELVATELLSRSPVLENASIRVSVSHDGVAVVSGSVGCFDEEDVARELVSRVEGIREIDMQVKTDPFLMRPQGAVEAQLLMSYADDPISSSYALVPTFSDGRLVLTGTVASPEEKDRLLLTSLVSGVMECDAAGVVVDPQLAVAGIAEKDYQTSDILKVLDRVIETDPRLAECQLVTGFVGSRLTIDGVAPSAAAREACLADARALPGVTGIDARIAIGDGVGPSLSAN
ncbi:BON domain-containing protein [Haloferula sargassicola]